MPGCKGSLEDGGRIHDQLLVIGIPILDLAKTAGLKAARRHWSTNPASGAGEVSPYGLAVGLHSARRLEGDAVVALRHLLKSAADRDVRLKVAKLTEGY